MIFENERTSKLAVSAISALKVSICIKDLILKKGSTFIFTCGAQPNEKNPKGRDRIMEYASQNLKSHNFFMAEDIFKGLGDHKLDLLTIEEILADYSDCIIIVLESESTFSELGAFTMHEDLVKNVLVVNDEKFRKSDSFIKNGPLKKLDEKSQFRPVIHVKFDNFSRCFLEIEERLSGIKREKGKSKNFTNLEAYNKSKSKDRLVFILDLISIFSPITTKELINLLNYLYGGDSFDINLILAFLNSLNLIHSVDKYHIRSTKDSKLFYTYNVIDIKKIRASILQNYYKNSRKRYRLLSQRT